MKRSLFVRRLPLFVATLGVLSYDIPFTGAQDNVYVFSYFKNPDGLDGMHLAYSLDGLSWHAVNNDQGLITPPSGSLMRDPSIDRGPDGKFRMVYTVSWGATTDIGYAESTDLATWTNQKNLPVMAGYTNVANSWAPELFYDTATSKHTIIWASAVNGVGHRIYETSTTDFNTFAPSVKFYDPGFDVIDATIVKDGNNHVMLVKDERQTGGYLYVFKAQGGTSAEGTYDTTTIPRISGNYAFEGPTAIKIGNTWYCYGDRYGEGRMGLLTSTDNMQTWTERVDDVTFPTGTKHGTVFSVPRSVIDGLIAAKPTSQLEFDGQTGSTDLMTAGNWLGNALPIAGKIPVIQTSHTATLSQTLSGTQNEFWVGETTPGTLNMSAGAITMSGWLCVGRNNGSAGSVLNQSGGVVTSVNASLGSVGTNAEGKYNLSGNAKLALSGNLFLGEKGTGTITQGAGTTVTISGYTSIGKQGIGTYNLTGGILTESGDFNIADYRGSQGNMRVSGGTFTAGSLYVGSGYNSGTGQSLGSVSQTGGTVRVSRTGDQFVIGGRDTTYGTGSYALSGGSLQTGSSNLFVGSHGQGTFVQTGGDLQADQWVSVGRYAGGVGTATVTGGTFRQTNSATRLLVGENGTGLFNVGTGGTVDLTGGLRISSTAGIGTVSLNGGTVTTALVEDGGGTSALILNGGTLRPKAANATFLQGLDSAIVQTGGAKVDAQTFNITIAQSIQHDSSLGNTTDGGFTKSGTGVVTLSGTNTYTGATSVNTGELKITGIYAPTTSTNSTLSVTGTALANVDTGIATFKSISATNLTVQNGGVVKVNQNGGNSGTSKINTLTITGASKLDLNDNDLVLTGTSESAVRTNLINGFHNGDWRGNGLTSTTAANNTSGLTALGYANNKDLALSSFGGVSLGTTDIMVKYTYYGDTDLNGRVTLEDFTQFLVGYQQVGTASWLNGDFDYSGIVNLEDFTLFLAGYQGPNTQLAPSLAIALSTETPHGVPLAESISIVPEPTSLSLLAVGAIGLLRRRK